MYNTERIDKFLEKVRGQIQEVMDKNKDEFINLVQSELHPKHELYSAMGACVISRISDGENLYTDSIDEFKHVLQNAVFYDSLRVNLDLPYYVTKDYASDEKHINTIK